MIGSGVYYWSYAVSFTFALVFQFGTVGIDLLWHTLEYILWLRRRSDGSQSQPWEGNKCCVLVAHLDDLCIYRIGSLPWSSSLSSFQQRVHQITTNAGVLDIKYTLNYFLPSQTLTFSFLRTKTQIKIWPLYDFEEARYWLPAPWQKSWQVPSEPIFVSTFRDCNLSVLGSLQCIFSVPKDIFFRYLFSFDYAI